MKTDRLEEFIKQNKEGFGPETTAPDVWAKVKKRQPNKSAKTIIWQTWLARAASVALIFVASYYFHDYMADSRVDQGLLTKENLKSSLFMELIEADEYYSAQVNEKKEELFQLAENLPGLQTDVNNELADLDALLLELKDDLSDDADNAEVIEAMMQNYRLKLEILEDMLEQLSAKQENKSKDEEGYSI